MYSFRHSSWWLGSGSNRLRIDFQSIALPFELPSHWDGNQVVGATYNPKKPSVLTEGLEPPRELPQQILSLPRLPVPPCEHVVPKERLELSRHEDHRF